MLSRGKVTPLVYRSVVVEPENTSYVPNTRLTGGHVTFTCRHHWSFSCFSRRVCVDLLQGWLMEKEEGLKPTSSVAHESHAPPLLKVSNGYGLISLFYLLSP